MDPDNWTASCVITGQLVSALRGQEEFWKTDHSSCLRQVRTAVWKRSVLLMEEVLVETIAGDPVQGAHQL